jgi:predicted nuclease of predicted toxin-antitoxin system
VKILLDENLPESLLKSLQRVGHQVDSVNTLRLKGIDNGTLYRQVAQNYELCFTRDGFQSPVKLYVAVTDNDWYR